MASGFPVFEACEVVGGICASYYRRPGEGVRLPEAPASDDAYRFEYGGGHWIFGGDSAVLHFINALTPVRTYHRKSAVYFPEDGRLVPYPLQHHLAYKTKLMKYQQMQAEGLPCFTPFLIEAFQWMIG